MSVKEAFLILFMSIGIFYMNNKPEMRFLNEPKEDIYPMPMFCLLTVENIQKSVGWYIKTLGYRVIFAVQDPLTKENSFVHLRRKKYQDILLRQGKVDKEKNSYGIAVTFQAWYDIDSLTNKAKENGALIVVEPMIHHGIHEKLPFKIWTDIELILPSQERR